MNLLDLYLKENHGVPHKAKGRDAVFRYTEEKGFEGREEGNGEFGPLIIQINDGIKAELEQEPYRKAYTFMEAANDNENTYVSEHDNGTGKMMVKSKTHGIGVYWADNTDFPNPISIEQINGRWFRVENTNDKQEESE